MRCWYAATNEGHEESVALGQQRLSQAAVPSAGSHSTGQMPRTQLPQYCAPQVVVADGNDTGASKQGGGGGMVSNMIGKAKGLFGGRSNKKR